MTKAIPKKKKCKKAKQFSEEALLTAKKRRNVKGNRRRGRQRMRWLDSIINSMNMNLRKFPETVEDRGAQHAMKLQRIGHDLPRYNNNSMATLGF